MNRLTRLALVLVGGVLAAIASAGAAEACWCSRAYTSCYYNPCVTCPTVTRSYYVPVASCPTVCSTTNVERCYYEPQVTYETRSFLEPRLAYVRRSYYDPLTCCYRSYLEPTTQYVERSYQVPVTNWVTQCATEPITSCAASSVACASYYVPTYAAYSYWTPFGRVVRWYPAYAPVVVNTSCPVPNGTTTNGTNGSGATQRESSYPPTESGKDKPAADKKETPAPIPMPPPPKTNQSSTQRSNRASPGVARASAAQSPRAPVRRVSSPGWGYAGPVR